MKFPNFRTADIFAKSSILAASIFLLNFVVSAQLNRSSIEKPDTNINVTEIKSSPVGVPVPLANPTPTSSEILSGTNATCSDLIGRSPNVVDNNELKLNFNGVYSDTFDFRTYTSAEGSVILTGIQTTPPNTIQVTTSGTNMIDSFFSEKAITAVILKVGSDSYVFYYNVPGVGYTFSGGPLGPTVPDQRGTSHINFCYTPTLIPTAAPAAIMGRVLSSNGSPLCGINISVRDITTGEVRTATTNSFGYYTFEDLRVEDFYQLFVSSKHYRFQNPSMMFTLFDNVAGMDFFATSK